MNKKISLIGAGSRAFSLSLTRDLRLTRNLEGCTASLMDTDSERLEGSYNPCRRYAEELGTTIRFEKTLSREESLQGADLVINTTLSACYHRLRVSREIGRRHSFRRGGSLAIMHDEALWSNFYRLRLFESIMQGILRICPNAWYLQVANSVRGGTTYLTRHYPELKMTDLCHGFGEISHIAQLVLGNNFYRQSLPLEAPGVNHFIGFTKMFYKGEDLLPRFADWVKHESKKYLIVESIACDLPRNFIVNIPNRGGYLPGDPADFAVEVTALVSARGTQGIQTDGLSPAVLIYLIRDHVVPAEIELITYRRGSQRLLEGSIDQPRPMDTLHATGSRIPRRDSAFGISPRNGGLLSIRKNPCLILSYSRFQFENN